MWDKKADKVKARWSGPFTFEITLNGTTMAIGHLDGPPEEGAKVTLKSVHGDLAVREREPNKPLRMKKRHGFDFEYSLHGFLGNVYYRRLRLPRRKAETIKAKINNLTMQLRRLQGLQKGYPADGPEGIQRDSMIRAIQGEIEEWDSLST
jgi:hypothetical protein